MQWTLFSMPACYTFSLRFVTLLLCIKQTLALDIKNIISNVYVIKSIQPFDMFPQAGHMESVSAFEKARGQRIANFVGRSGVTSPGLKDWRI